MKAENYMRISDARKEVFDAPRQTYVRWIKDGSIKAIKFNDSKTTPYLLDKQSLLSFIETLQQPMPV